MRESSQSLRVLDLASQKGTLRAADLLPLGLPRVVLTRLAASGKLERIGRGLYRLPDAHVSEYDSLVRVARKLPQAVICLLSALQFHELTTQLPRKVWIAMPQGSHVPKFDYPPLKMVQCSSELFSEGVEVHERDQVELRVYGIARTVADCFKHRNKIGLDVVLEALREVRTKHKASIDEIWHFAKLCRVSNVMRPYLEILE